MQGILLEKSVPLQGGLHGGKLLLWTGLEERESCEKSGKKKGTQPLEGREPPFVRRGGIIAGKRVRVDLREKTQVKKKKGKKTSQEGKKGMPLEGGKRRDSGGTLLRSC